MFGINGAEFVVLLLIAAVVIGPERLPTFAEQLARWVRALRTTVAATKDQLAAEMGEDAVDWAALDPRRYDPRRIVRDALGDLAPDVGPPAPGPAVRRDGAPAPFDDEAT